MPVNEWLTGKVCDALHLLSLYTKRIMIPRMTLESCCFEVGN